MRHSRHCAALLVLLAAAACSERTASAPPDPPPLRPHIMLDTLERLSNTGPAPSLTQLFGAVHPPLPDGFETLAGALVVPSERGRDGTHVLEHVRAGSMHLLVLSRVIGRTYENNQSAPVLRVVAMVEAPRHERDKRLRLVGCTTSDGGIAAAWVDRVLPGEDAEVYLAWRVDVAADRLIAIDVSEVRCVRVPAFR